jgi:hypothetical protein
VSKPSTDRRVECAQRRAKCGKYGGKHVEVVRVTQKLN